MRAFALASSFAVASALGLSEVERVRGPAEWKRGKAVAAGTELEFNVALKHSKKQLEWLRAKVAAVSTPGSKEYGKHLSLDQLTAQLAQPEGAAAVRAALKSAGVDNVELLRSGDWMRFSATADVAEKVFGTPFCEWGHEDGDSVIRACNTAYSVPTAAREHIDFVSGLVHFPSHKGRARKLSSPSADSGDVATLRTSYSIGEVKATSGNSSAAFTQFIGQWYGHNMLPKFLNKYTPDMADQPAPKAVGPDRSGAGTEANLDAQYITAMGHGADIWVWTNQNKNSVNNQEPWVQFFSNVSAAADLPLIFSISYGEGEDTLTKDYMDRSDVELQKIATRGISMMAASGDNGAGCSDGKFVANFPADLPHITSVGGTSSCRSGSGAAGFSSGGFSNTYPQQSWQAAAVKTYLSGSNVPASSYFNASGRAYPDVAACGSVVICSDFICGLGVEGTSCASPIFAGTMALVNDKRLAAGKSPLGFLNPMLYANAAAFDDVTSGSTQGCVGARWTAVAGWDPTTGLGTPNYSKLVAAALAL